MKKFASSLLRVTKGGPHSVKPVAFSGHVSESDLESWVLADPELLGEPLLVLGNQLAEFSEDKDRLDILALDRDREVVVIELKVSEDFRVTDLQALAYAGAYASQSTEHFAETLKVTLEKQQEAENTPPPDGHPITAPLEAVVDQAAPQMANPDSGTQADKVSSRRAAVSLEESKQRICDFLGIEEFGAWEPSQQMRIKLVAPNFPQRVLKTVKWLGDVYNMPIEAIAVRLFLEPGEEGYGLTFDRILPLPDDSEFDMTVRKREEKKRSANTKKRPDVVPLLVKEGVLKEGDKLWLTESVLPVADRKKYDPESPIYQVEVRLPDGSQPRFAWRANDADQYELLAPSAVTYRIYRTVLSFEGEPFGTAVATSFVMKPKGDTLEEVAIQNGFWSPLGS